MRGVIFAILLTTTVSFPVCSSANDTSGNEKVAIKKITDTFENRVMFTRTLREIKLLRLLKHPNVIPNSCLSSWRMPRPNVWWRSEFVECHFGLIATHRVGLDETYGRAIPHGLGRLFRYTSLSCQRTYTIGRISTSSW